MTQWSGSADAQAALEASLRRMSWKQLTRCLKEAVEAHHQPLELPPMIRRWLR